MPLTRSSFSRCLRAEVRTRHRWARRRQRSLAPGQPLSRVPGETRRRGRRRRRNVLRGRILARRSGSSGCSSRTLRTADPPQCPRPAPHGPAFFAARLWRRRCGHRISRLIVVLPRRLLVVENDDLPFVLNFSFDVAGTRYGGEAPRCDFEPSVMYWIRSLQQEHAPNSPPLQLRVQQQRPHALHCRHQRRHHSVVDRGSRVAREGLVADGNP